MKQLINIKAILPAVLTFVILLGTGCSDDFLNVIPQDNYTEDNYWASDDALRAAVDPLYNRAWFGFNDRAILGLGSLRGNDAYNQYLFAEFVRFQTTALTPQVATAWSSLYAVINMSNAVIYGITEKCDTTKTSRAARNTALGEAYLMRGTAYFFGVRIWGPMILTESNVELVAHPIRPLNPEEDVFKFIIRDLRKASELLPPVVGKDPTGRATVWAAKAMLAKALLARSGWNKAERDGKDLEECIKLCEDIIANSGAKLIDYEDLFKYKFNVNDETLFALRWRVAPSSIWGTQNTMISDIAFAETTDIMVWAGSLCATIDMMDLYNLDPLTHDAIRRKATFFIPGEHYSYIWAAEGGYKSPIAADGTGWLRVKKGIVGTKADNDGNLSQQNSPLHTPILRFADVYLTHAEACLGNKAELTDGPGLISFNTVRDRADVSQKDKITFQDIMNERRIEFCMEYQTWFEMLTWYRWKPDFMMNYFNDVQKRGLEFRDGAMRLNTDGSISWRVYTNSGPVLDWDSLEGFGSTSTSTGFVPTVISKENIFVPYPEADRVMNPYLSKDPEPYDFGDGE
jgi:hypothetical protein